jgi:cell division protein FtsI (penicillin-binding protein 3)
MVIVAICVFGKAFFIQQVQGKMWRSMSDSLHQKMQEIDAERGTIYSEDGQMLSTSIPQFDIYIDFDAEGLRDKDGKRFFENVDSLSISLSNLFKDKSISEYKKMLKDGYRSKDRYFMLHKKVSYADYEMMRNFPLVRLGRNKSGFIAEVKSIRLNPYQMMAFRTIGLDRDSFKVGLEMTYDSLLKGKQGKRLVRYIAGGVAMPVDDDYQIEPENGKDIVTTIDTRMQEIAENALMKMLIQNDAEHGCAIVMEVKTGKIKAIANLGKQNDGNYWEDYNYAMTPTEPGSTFKLVTLLSMLEDKKVTLDNHVDLSGGRWNINGQTVIDAEEHTDNDVTIKRAFELSSNVGMAKLAYGCYATTPSQFVNHIKKLRLDSLTGIDLYGERSPVIYKPGSKYWSATTLPWMAFGYNLEIAPLHTAMLYNAIANGGVMMKPYLLDDVMKDGAVIKQSSPIVLRDKICSDETLKQLKECLIGVCTDPGSTAYKLFKGSNYTVAGKTGTALMAEGAKGYVDHIYQSSFAGFFPADNPQYTCVVVIRNKPNALIHVGASVAGPVFREIADRLYTMYVRQPAQMQYTQTTKNDSLNYNYTATRFDINQLMHDMNITYTTDASNGEWATISKSGDRPFVNNEVVADKSMPALTGMGLKDAVFICETMGLKVNVKGKGKVISQSINEGQGIVKGQKVDIQLN